ncbi:hypothetical protein Ccrd_019433 [Cynara cardunculus var. scolymus]|uniref:non-specific serine/threonine protein kinase n=1 Tax=Cynara cardunculus var. scolymus TaxID=59895 RepID=A0A103Y4C1_CYNCS|nr:hypothetical protein Ccrd_019433 [Cynara cardunculus var. scolymus]
MGMSISNAKKTIPPAPAPADQIPGLTRAGSILGIPTKNIEDYYKIGRELGRGKFAVTSLCRDKSTGKKYACKSIPKRRLVTESEKQDLKREVMIMEHLRNQRNVVELKDAFEDKRCVHLVMEYCEGGELFEKMKSKEDQWLVENGEATDSPIDSMFLARMKHFKALNEFKKLALKIIADIIPHEELEGFEAMFRNMDTDENKVISREELESSLARLGSNLGPDEVQLISEAADADGDGCIDYNEFITAMMNFQRFHKKEHLVKAFQHFDKDKNGIISKGELKVALEEYKLGKATIEDIVSEVDTNKTDLETRDPSGAKQ